MPNNFSLLSGSQTHTGQVKTAYPDIINFSVSQTGNFKAILDGLSGNADLQLKNSSGTVLNSSSLTGTTPEEINFSDLAAGDYSLIVTSAGGDINYSLSLTIGEVANSEKTAVDSLTGISKDSVSSSGVAVTATTANKPLEKPTATTDLVTGDVENQASTNNTKTTTTSATNSTDKVTDSSSLIGTKSATEKPVETLATTATNAPQNTTAGATNSTDKVTDSSSLIGTKSATEKPVETLATTATNAPNTTTAGATNSTDKVTDSSSLIGTKSVTEKPVETLATTATNAPQNTTAGATNSTDKVTDSSSLIGTKSVTEKPVETLATTATNAPQTTTAGETNSSDKVTDSSSLIGTKSATEKPLGGTETTPEKSPNQPITAKDPITGNALESTVDSYITNTQSTGITTDDLTGNSVEKKPEISPSNATNNNQSADANLPEKSQGTLAEVESKSEAVTSKNAPISELKETAKGDNLTTEKDIATSTEVSNDSSKPTPTVSSSEKDPKAANETKISTTETPTELNPVTQPELTASTDPFISGKFKVDSTGKVGIDFLFDGGFYKGQLAIFSLKGMAIFVPGSKEFIKEATARTLSNSVNGHVVISDITEGARFSGNLGEENFNSGEYLGVKTFDMNPGDEFGMMMVPNGTVQEVFDNPGIGGDKRPLFSLATANPLHGMHINQMVDITGEGNTFSMEDLRADGWTDKDYNEPVFQVRGAVGKAVLMDDVVAAGKDWRKLDLGKALVDYAKAYVTPELVEAEADNTPTTGVTDPLSEDDTNNNNNTSTTGVKDPLSEDETSNNNNTPTTGVTDPLSEDETSNNNNTPTTEVTNPLSEDETSNNNNTPTTGVTESTDKTQTGNDSVIDRTNVTDNNSAIVEKEIPTVTEPVLSNITKSVEASVGSNGTPTVTNTTATTPGADVSLKPVAPVTTTDIVTVNKPVAPVTTTDIVTGNKPVAPVTNTDVVTGNKPVTPAVGSTVVKIGETSNVVTSTVPKVSPSNSTQTTTTVNSQVTPVNVGSNVAPTVTSTAVTTAPTYNFPPADQPLVSAINKELLPNSGNWAQSLIEFVDNAKISPQPNAVVNINLDLTQILPDGSVAPRYELTSKEEEAIAYAQKHNILVVVPVGDNPAQVSALGQLSKQYDNIIAVGAAKRVNDAIAPFKAFAPAPDSGRGEALNILADVSGEGAGTSLAAAKVTDAVSSVWAANPKLNYTQVIDLLKRTATDLGKPNWDVDTGAGLLNVAAAVNLAKATQPEPYTVKPGQQTITDNFISQNNAAKVLPGIPTHPAVTPPGVPQTAADQGANNLAGTPIQISSTQDVIDQVSAIDPADVYRVESRYLAGSEFSVLSGQLSVSFVTPTGQVLGSQVFAAGNHTLQLPAGVPNEVLVKIDSQGGAPATYRLKGFESQAPEPFNIDLEFVGGLTASQQAIMQAAAKSVASLIGKGLPSAIVDGKIIDDINIKVSTANIDGGNGTQAQTKIDFMRYGTLLPAQSITQFDAADIGKLESSGELFSVAQHEFLHALGFGNLWEAKGLVDYAGTPLAQFNGRNSVAAFKELGGLTDAISLETEGKGSAGLHWHEALFQDDVMTADLNFSGKGGNAPISTVTIASLADLGYQVNLERATPDFGLFGGQRFNANDLTLEQIEAFRELAEISLGAQNEISEPAIMPEIDPDKVAPEIWAHAERGPDGEYYDWEDYQIVWRDTLSDLAEWRMGSGSANNYWWIANHNAIPNPDYIQAGKVIKLPVHRPNYERDQEAERLRREDELRQRQEQEARERQQQEDRLRNDQAEQERLRQDEERRRQEAEANQRALEEQARRLAEEQERRRREREEYEREQARLAELRRQAEIARQQGKGGLEWYLAKPMPEFGPVDPFETSLTGETVGNLVPDDYYRFTLSRGGRITAELRQMLADADLVLYDARNEPIAYSMREGITDEQIIADLIPGTYMLRVNSPKGVTTDYDLVVKFQHKLSQMEIGPPPGWRVGGTSNGGSSGGGNTSPGVAFADPRIQQIYDTALNQFETAERGKANAQIRDLEAEKRQYQQELNDLLAQMNTEQRTKVYTALDGVRNDAFRWLDSTGAANGFDNFVNGIFDKIPPVYNVPGIGVALRIAKDSAKAAFNGALSSINGKVNSARTEIKNAVSWFVEALKNAYRTGGEINSAIEGLARELKGKIDAQVANINNGIDWLKTEAIKNLGGLRNVGIGGWNFYDNLVVPQADNLANLVKNGVGAIANYFKGTVDYVKPRAQKTVADIVSALLGDQTGNLYNNINGIDQQIAATTRAVEERIVQKAVEIKADIDGMLNNLQFDGLNLLDTLLDFGKTPAGQTMEGQVGMAMIEVGLGLIPVVGQVVDIKDTVAALYKWIFKGEQTLEVAVEFIAALAGWVPLVGDAIKSVAKIVLKGPIDALIKQLGPEVTQQVAKALKETQWKTFVIDVINKVVAIWRKFDSTMDNAAGWILDLLPGFKPTFKAVGDAMMELSNQAPKLGDSLDDASKQIAKKVDDEVLKLPGPDPNLPKLTGSVKVAPGSVDDLIIGTDKLPLKSGVNPAIQYEKNGGVEKAWQDYQDFTQGLNPQGKNTPDGFLYVVELPDGSKAIGRGFSSGDVPTIEIQKPNKEVIKVRYKILNPEIPLK
jgi:hypothetical protein